MPGAAHVSNDFREEVINLQRNRAQLLHLGDLADLPPLGCAHQEFSNGPVRGIPGVVSPDDFPFSFVQNAAFRHLTAWVEHGRPPPHAPFIQVDTSSTPPSIVRDSLGNAAGGVRTPFLDVPIATYTPTDTVAHTTSESIFCILYGFNTPFDGERLAALYRNRADYVRRFARETARAVQGRFWLVPDAIAAIERALHAPLP